MPLPHRLPRIQVLIRWMPRLRKRHALPRPIRPEPTGLNTHKPDPPLRLQLVRNRLREPLDRPLRRAVDAEQRHAPLPADRSHLLDQPAARRLRPPHHPERFARHVHQPEEVDFHLRPDLRVAELLECAGEAVPSVVDYDVYSAELVQRGDEGGGMDFLSVTSRGRARYLEDVVPEKESWEGLRAVVTAMSPRERTCWTGWAPKPVEVPVMRKMRSMANEGKQDN
jgi:hypothetical protein